MSKPLMKTMPTLSPGMIVELYTGPETSSRKYVLLVTADSGYVLGGRDLDVGEKFPETTLELDDYTTVNYDSIVKVFDFCNQVGAIHDLVVHGDEYSSNLLWEKARKMTREELREILGYTVELVD